MSGAPQPDNPYLKKIFRTKTEVVSKNHYLCGAFRGSGEIWPLANHVKKPLKKHYFNPFFL